MKMFSIDYRSFVLRQLSVFEINNKKEDKQMDVYCKLNIQTIENNKKINHRAVYLNRSMFF
jgi:hypothetical protein